MAGESGQTDRIGDGNRDAVSQLVEPGCHLAGSQPGAFSEEDAYVFSICHKYITDTNKYPPCRDKRGFPLFCNDVM